MKASVDAKTCIGCGLCAGTCAAVFEMRAGNVAQVRANPVPKDAEAACREAAAGCPVEAIELTD
jgi:ferredoxin